MPRRHDRQRLAQQHVRRVAEGVEPARAPAVVAETPTLEIEEGRRIRVAWADLPVRALYRAQPADKPVECEIIAKKSKRLVLREVSRPLAGVWTARRDQVAPLLHADAHDFGVWLRLNLMQLGAL